QAADRHVAGRSDGDVREGAADLGVVVRPRQHVAGPVHRIIPVRAGGRGSAVPEDNRRRQSGFEGLESAPCPGARPGLAGLLWLAANGPRPATEETHGLSPYGTRGVAAPALRGTRERLLSNLSCLTGYGFPTTGRLHGPLGRSGIPETAVVVNG